jgi:hypothetical protein
MNIILHDMIPYQKKIVAQVLKENNKKISKVMELRRFIEKKLSLTNKDDNHKEYVVMTDKILNQIHTLIGSDDIFFKNILTKNDLQVLKRRSIILALRDTRKVYRKLGHILNILHLTKRINSLSDDFKKITADIHNKIIEIVRLYDLPKDTLSKFISSLSPPTEFIPLKEIRKIIILIKKYNENKIHLHSFHSQFNNIFANMKNIDGKDIFQNKCYTKLNTSRFISILRDYYREYSWTQFYKKYPQFKVKLSERRSNTRSYINYRVELKKAGSINIKEFISFHDNDAIIKKKEYMIDILKNIDRYYDLNTGFYLNKKFSVDEIQSLLLFVNLIRGNKESKKNRYYYRLVSEFYTISQKIQTCIGNNNNITRNTSEDMVMNMIATMQNIVKEDKAEICTDQQYNVQCSSTFKHTENSNDSSIIILFVIGSTGALLLLIIIFFMILCYRRNRQNINTEPVTREDGDSDEMKYIFKKYKKNIQI